MYYIYYHIDPRDNLPKYIGKGSGRRAWSFYSRNKKHQEWVKELKNNNLEPIVSVGNYFESEKEAYKIEKIEISLLKKLNCSLLNISKGGSGCSADLIKKPIICITNSTVYDSAKDASLKLGILAKRICDVLKGRKRSYKGYSFRYTNEQLNIEPDKKRAKADFWNKHTTSKPIICVDTGEIFISITEAAKKIGVDNSHICQHLKGKLKQVKGYKFRRI